MSDSDILSQSPCFLAANYRFYSAFESHVLQQSTKLNPALGHGLTHTAEVVTLVLLASGAALKSPYCAISKLACSFKTFHSLMHVSLQPSKLTSQVWPLSARAWVIRFDGLFCLFLFSTLFWEVRTHNVDNRPHTKRAFKRFSWKPPSNRSLQQ
jgi:hypothetical protein